MSNHEHKHDEKDKHHGHEHSDKKHDKEQKQQDETVAADVADIEVNVPDPELVAAKAKIDELTNQIAAANDKYLRLMAEFDNFKRRTAKEYQQLIEQANEKLMKDVIEVRETFERAFKSDPSTTDSTAFADGMKMIFTKLDTVLHKHGLEIYCEVGQAFDPEFHDAMMKCAHDTVPEEHVMEVLEKGYKLKGKVIKHSRVIVSSGKPAPVEQPKPEPVVVQKDAQNGDDEAVFEVGIDKKEGA